MIRSSKNKKKKEFALNYCIVLLFIHFNYYFIECETKKLNSFIQLFRRPSLINIPLL